jgi:hypothetical protein
MRTCKHVKANGEFCGSPALRGREYCYFHLTVLGRRLRTQKHIMKGENHYLQLPTLEDANSIQMALMQVMDALLRDQIDTKVAGLLLYGLQIASSNLQHGANFSQGQSATVAASYDNFEQDYDLADTDCGLKVPEEEEEHHAKVGNEIDLAGAVPAAPVPKRILKDAGSQGFLVRFRPQDQNDDTQLAEKPREVA